MVILTPWFTCSFIKPPFTCNSRYNLGFYFFSSSRESLKMVYLKPSMWKKIIKDRSFIWIRALDKAHIRGARRTLRWRRHKHKHKKSEARGSAILQRLMGPIMSRALEKNVRPLDVDPYVQGSHVDMHYYWKWGMTYIVFKKPDDKEMLTRR